jgi:hypothetical protein
LTNAATVQQWVGWKDYFKTEKLNNVEADVDLVIFAKIEADDEAPARKRGGQADQQQQQQVCGS